MYRLTFDLAGTTFHSAWIPAARELADVLQNLLGMTTVIHRYDVEYRLKLDAPPRSIATCNGVGAVSWYSSTEQWIRDEVTNALENS